MPYKRVPHGIRPNQVSFAFILFLCSFKDIFEGSQKTLVHAGVWGCVCVLCGGVCGVCVCVCVGGAGD